jgi:hypothetical protein
MTAGMKFDDEPTFQKKKKKKEERERERERERRILGLSGCVPKKALILSKGALRSEAPSIGGPYK